MAICLSRSSQPISVPLHPYPWCICTAFAPKHSLGYARGIIWLQIESIIAVLDMMIKFYLDSCEAKNTAQRFDGSWLQLWWQMQKGDDGSIFVMQVHLSSQMLHHFSIKNTCVSSIYQVNCEGNPKYSIILLTRLPCNESHGLTGGCLWYFSLVWRHFGGHLWPFPLRFFIFWRSHSTLISNANTLYICYRNKEEFSWSTHLNKYGQPSASAAHTFLWSNHQKEHLDDPNT